MVKEFMVYETRDGKHKARISYADEQVFTDKYDTVDKLMEELTKYLKSLDEITL